jgi:hypothetical protein
VAVGHRTLAHAAVPGDLLTRVLLFFAALVVAYDALASALVLATGWPYGTLALGALAIQAAAGRAAGQREGFVWAILAGASTALVEATLGFAVSWLIGPGRTQLPAAFDYPTAAALATLGGGALGALGAPAEALQRRRCCRESLRGAPASSDNPPSPPSGGAPGAARN